MHKPDALSLRALAPSVVLCPQVVPDAGGLKQVASPFDEGVAKSILPRLDWAALRKTAAEVSESNLNPPP